MTKAIYLSMNRMTFVGVVSSLAGGLGLVQNAK